MKNVRRITCCGGRRQIANCGFFIGNKVRFVKFMD